MDADALRIYQLAAVRDGLDQAGQDGDGKISGGLAVGTTGPAPGAGELVLRSCVRESVALGAVAYISADQSIPSVTWTAITWAAEEWDTDLIWDAGAPTLFTVHTAGVYMFYGFVLVNNFAAGYCFMVMKKNGVEVLSARTTIAGGRMELHLCGFAWANENDVFELSAYQDTGGGALLLKYDANRLSSAGIVRVV